MEGEDEKEGEEGGKRERGKKGRKGKGERRKGIEGRKKREREREKLGSYSQRPHGLWRGQMCKQIIKVRYTMC